MNKWQPIETAPKDGTAILAHLPYSDIAIPIRYDGNCWHVTWDMHKLGEWDQPDFWMPMPKPPKE